MTNEFKYLAVSAGVEALTLKQDFRLATKLASDRYDGASWYAHPEGGVAVDRSEPPEGVQVAPESAEREGWVKLAQSPTLRGAGELAGFFNWDSPVGALKGTPLRAALTSGILGAGLGYGGARLVNRVLPGQFEEKRLNRMAALLGALGGVAGGGLYAGANKMVDLPLNSSQLLNPDFGRDQVKKASTFASGDFSVNTDTMGRVLWEAGADPQTMATTMGTLYAASTMPDPRAEPGWVTPAQMARLSAGMGAGYLSGSLVGSLLGAVTGLKPDSQRVLARSGAAVGLVQQVIPKLFGAD